MIRQALQNHCQKLHFIAGLFRRADAVQGLGGAVPQDFQRTGDIQAFRRSGSTPLCGTDDVQSFGGAGTVAFCSGISDEDLLCGCKH